LFLAGTALFALFRKLYRFAVLAGIVLLACVFVEPAPADVILAAAVPLGLLSGAFKPRPLGKASLPAALLLLYFIASLPGIAVSADLASAARFFLITLYLFLLALFVCTYATGDNIHWLLRAYVVAAFVSLAAGIAGLLGFFPQILMMDPFRVKGLFKDPNVFGPFFVPAVVLLLDDRKRKRILKAPAALHWIGAALLSLGVLFSYSRAAWINQAISVALYLALNIKAFKPAVVLRAVVFGAAAAGIVLGVLMAHGGGSTDIISFIEERAKMQSYDSDRFGAQQGGLTLISENPLGVGPGQFEKNIAGVTGQELSSHSLYIRTASESGVAGFLLFFAAVGCVLVMLWKEHRKSKELGPGAMIPSPAALLAILMGLLVNSLVVDTLHWRHLWFFIGIAFFYIREAQGKAVPNG
jgi:O-antigen ligase